VKETPAGNVRGMRNAENGAAQADRPSLTGSKDLLIEFEEDLE
jgi:hypothetical protein